MKFKGLNGLQNLMEVIDLDNKIKQELGLKGTLYCNINVIPYLTKINGFSLGDKYSKVLQDGQGVAGLYKGCTVYVSSQVPDNTIYFEEGTPWI